MESHYSTVELGGVAGDWIEIEFIQTNTNGGLRALRTHIGGTNNRTSTTAWVLRDGVIIGHAVGRTTPPASRPRFSDQRVVTPYTLSQRVRVTLTGPGTGGNASGTSRSSLTGVPGSAGPWPGRVGCSPSPAGVVPRLVGRPSPTRRPKRESGLGQVPFFLFEGIRFTVRSV